MRKYKVLLIDDEPLIIKGLKILIDWEYYDCEITGEALDGHNGLKLIEELQPDIVITDIRMPYISGIEMIRTALSICKCKFIILSGYSDFDYARQCISLGVQDYLLKPVEEAQLTAVLKKIIYTLRKETVESEVLSFESCEKSNVIRQIETYIHAHIYDDLSLISLAQMFYISPIYLSRLFKKETGTLYIDYLTELKMNTALNLFLTTDMKVYEVADKLGYKDTKYFSRLFEKKIGYKPSDCRKNN